MIHKFFLIFFLLTSNFVIAENEYKILVTTNNIAITLLDLEKEIKIIKILNKNKLERNLNFKDIALTNLINENVKLIEIDKNNIKIDNQQIENYLNIFLKVNKFNKSEIDNEILSLIKKKIKIDASWNILINKLYGWKININMNEINNKIIDSKNKMTEKELESLKQKLLDLEKDKKLKVFDKYHFAKIKRTIFINYY